MITLLNTSILTAYGSYEYYPIDLEDAKKMLVDGFESAIGHSATAEILTELLQVPVEMNRIEYQQKAGSDALVFKLKARIPEGKILNRADIDAIGYEFGVLSRLK